MEKIANSFPLLGCGVGLRTPHYPVITSEWPCVDWFEAVTENYMDTGGRPVEILEKVRAHYPVGLHGVALSIGSTDRLNETYLERWKNLIRRIDPVIVSDHICWSGVDGEQLHDLLPLPFTEEALDLLVERVGHVQDFLKRQILLENVSSYVTFKHSAMPEWEFVRTLAERSGSGLLLDINNVYVNSKNHGFDPHEYIQNIPGEFVGQIHLAGHTDKGKYLFDTHSAPVIDEVWKLYAEALGRWGRKSTLIEWDDHIPPFERLVEEAEKARIIYEQSPTLSSVVGARFSRPRSATGRETPPLHTYGLCAPDGAPQAQSVSLHAAELWIKNHVYPGSADISSTMNGREILNPQGGDPGHLRLDVYREGYVARTYEALGEVYEAVKHFLGTDIFWDLARAYAKKYPSFDYNLNVKGRRLPEFLAGSAYARDFPFVADLAAFEWLVAESFHALLGPPFDPSFVASLNAEDWDHLRFTFQPSARLFESKWPILDLWEARKHSENDHAHAHLQTQPHRLLISRSHGAQVYCERLDPEPFSVLKGLLNGKTLGEVLEDMVDGGGGNYPLETWFAHWVGRGLISRCGIRQKMSCC